MILSTKSHDLSFCVNFTNFEEKQEEYQIVDGFRIIQECISNIIKHSNSKEVDLIIKKETDQIIVIIKDNGSGFNIAEIMGAKLHQGIGLMSLSERAYYAGVRLK